MAVNMMNFFPDFSLGGEVCKLLEVENTTFISGGVHTNQDGIGPVNAGAYFV